MAKLQAQLSLITLVFLLWSFQGSAIASSQQLSLLELNKVELSISPKTLTPGQQLDLILKVSYADTVTIDFNAEQVDWQAFTLLSSHNTNAKWLDGFWQKKYYISLSVPVAGQYQLPLLSIHSYLAEDHKQLLSSAQTIKVIKSLGLLKTTEKDNALTLPPLQDIERIVLAENDELKTMKPVLVIAVLFIACLIAFWFVAVKRKNMNVNDASPSSSVKRN